MRRETPTVFSTADTDIMTRRVNSRLSITLLTLWLASMQRVIMCPNLNIDLHQLHHHYSHHYYHSSHLTHPCHGVHESEKKYVFCENCCAICFNYWNYNKNHKINEKKHNNDLHHILYAFITFLPPLYCLSYKIIIEDHVL